MTQQVNIAQAIMAEAGKKMKSTSSISVQRVLPHGVSSKGDKRAEFANVQLTVGPEITSEAQLSNSMSIAFDNKVRVLPGSFYRPTESNDQLLAGMVALNRESRPFEAANMQGFSAVVANVFRDSDDKIWVKRGDGEAAMLVRESEDDLSAILDQRASLSIATAAVGVPLHEKFVTGQGVLWYDFKNEKTRVGIATHDSLAFDAETQEMCSLTQPQCIAVTPMALSATELAGIAPISFVNGQPLSRENMVEKHLDYMRVLYGARPEYFQRLATMVRRQFGRAQLR